MIQKKNEKRGGGSEQEIQHSGFPHCNWAAIWLTGQIKLNVVLSESYAVAVDTCTRLSWVTGYITPASVVPMRAFSPSFAYMTKCLESITRSHF